LTLARANEIVRNLVIVNLFLVLITLGAVAASVLSATVRVGNVGNVKTIGLSVYSNANLSTSLTQIEWGFLEPN